MNDDQHRAPFEVLDGVEAPDSWDDVVARADQGTVLPFVKDPGRRSNRPVRLVGAAAAVLLLVGLTVAVVSRPDDRSDGNVTGGAPTTTSQSTTNDLSDADLARELFTRPWNAVEVRVDGVSQDLHAAGGLALRPAEGAERRALDFVDLVCEVSFAGEIEGGVWEPERHGPAVACNPGADRQRSTWVENLAAGPVAVSVDDDVLRLAGGGQDDRPNLEIDLQLADVRLTDGYFWIIDRIERSGEPSSTGDDADRPTSFSVEVMPTFYDGCMVGSASLGTIGATRLDLTYYGTMYLGCADPPDPVQEEKFESLARFLDADPLYVGHGDQLLMWTADERIVLKRQQPGVPGVGETPVELDAEDPNHQDPNVLPWTEDEGPAGVAAVATIEVDGVTQPVANGWLGGPLMLDFRTPDRLRIFGCETHEAVTTWADGTLTADSFEKVGAGSCSAEEAAQEELVRDLFVEGLQFDTRAPFARALGLGTKAFSDRAHLDLVQTVSVTEAQRRCNAAGSVEVAVRIAAVWNAPGDAVLVDEAGAVVSEPVAVVDDVAVFVDPPTAARAVVVRMDGTDLRVGAAPIAELPGDQPCR